VVSAGGRPLPDDAAEVLGVFTYQRSTVRCGTSEKLFVDELRQAWVIGGGVVALDHVDQAVLAVDPAPEMSSVISAPTALEGPDASGR
jgi:hypothetical protein